MRSLWQIISAVTDGNISTREQATALLEDEVQECVAWLGISETEARAQLLANIAGVSARFYSESEQKYIGDLFGLTRQENDDNHETTTQTEVS